MLFLLDTGRLLRPVVGRNVDMGLCWDVITIVYPSPNFVNVQSLAF